MLLTGISALVTGTEEGLGPFVPNRYVEELLA